MRVGNAAAGIEPSYEKRASAREVPATCFAVERQAWRYVSGLLALPPSDRRSFKKIGSSLTKTDTFNMIQMTRLTGCLL